MKLTDYPPVYHDVYARRMTVADMLCIITAEIYNSDDDFEGIRIVNIANGTADEYTDTAEMIADDWQGMRKIEVLFRHSYREQDDNKTYYVCVYNQTDDEEDEQDGIA